MLKNSLILSALLSCICACGSHSLTTFKLSYPANETRKVDWETVAGRQTLVFEERDSVREVALQLPLERGEYVRLWVGDMSYTVWVETGKPWEAKFKWNEWHFEGQGAEVNNYLNKRISNPVFFTDYYRIPTEAFRTKLLDEISERETALRKANLDMKFMEREMKRFQYIRNLHLASRGVYGEEKDWRMNLMRDFYLELQNAIMEDSTSWGIFEYRESIDKALLALARMDGFQKSNRDSTLEILKMVIENYSDKRLIEYLVNKRVMKYIKVATKEDIGRLDSIFRQQVHTPELVAAYNVVYNISKKLMKGQPAVPFTFKDMDEKDVNLSDFKGKYVYIDLWATWCGPCVAEIPYLKKLEEHFRGRNICFVSISSDKDREIWMRFVRERDLKGIQLYMGEDKKYMKEINCDGIPRFLLIDREGNIIDANMTRPSETKTLKILEELEGL